MIVERADLYTRENVIFRDMLELLQDEEICVKVRVFLRRARGYEVMNIVCRSPLWAPAST